MENLDLLMRLNFRLATSMNGIIENEFKSNRQTSVVSSRRSHLSAIKNLSSTIAFAHPYPLQCLPLSALTSFRVQYTSFSTTIVAFSFIPFTKIDGVIIIAITPEGVI